MADDLEMDLDDDLDFDDEFDMGMDNPFAEEVPPKDTREAISRSLKKTSSSFLDEFNDNRLEAAGDVVKATIPKRLSVEADEYMKLAGGFKDELNKSATELKKNAIPLIEAIESISPKGGRAETLINLAKEKLGMNEEHQSSEDIAANAAAKATGEVLDALGEMQDKEQYAESIRTSIQNDSNKSQIQLLSKIGVNLESLNRFNIDVTNKYYRKSLELQYRHLYVANDQLELTKQGFDTFKNQLETIVGNTALPDIIKVRRSEVIKDKLFKKAADGLFARSSLFKNLKNKIANEVQGVTSVLANGMDSLSGGIEMAQSTAEMSEMAGGKEGMLASLAAGGVKGYVGGKVGDLISKTDIGKRGIDFAKSATMDLSGTFEELANKREDGLLKNIFSGISMFTENSDSANSFKVDRVDRNDVALFDGKVHTSITKIIPSLLSKILKETSSIRKGTEVDELRYDYRTDSFVSKGTLSGNVVNDMNKELVKSGTANSVNGIIDEITNEVGLNLSKEETEDLRQNILLYTLKNKSLSPTALSRNGFYDSLDSELGGRFKTALDEYISPSDGELKDKRIDFIYKELNNIKNVAPNPQKIIDDYRDNNSLDVLREQGFLTTDEQGNESFNLDTYKDTIGKSIRTMDKVEQQEEDNKSKSMLVNLIGKRIEDAKDEVSSNVPQFDVGGYTGKGDPRKIAGLVHLDEDVVNSKKLDKIANLLGDKDMSRDSIVDKLISTTSKLKDKLENIDLDIDKVTDVKDSVMSSKLYKDGKSTSIDTFSVVMAKIEDLNTVAAARTASKTLLNIAKENLDSLNKTISTPEIEVKKKKLLTLISKVEDLKIDKTTLDSSKETLSKLTTDISTVVKSDIVKEKITSTNITRDDILAEKQSSTSNIENILTSGDPLGNGIDLAKNKANSMMSGAGKWMFNFAKNRVKNDLARGKKLRGFLGKHLLRRKDTDEDKESKLLSIGKKIGSGFLSAGSLAKRGIEADLRNGKRIRNAIGMSSVDLPEISMPELSKPDTHIADSIKDKISNVSLTNPISNIVDKAKDITGISSKDTNVGVLDKLIQDASTEINIEDDEKKQSISKKFFKAKVPTFVANMLEKRGTTNIIVDAIVKLGSLVKIGIDRLLGGGFDRLISTLRNQKSIEASSKKPKLSIIDKIKARKGNWLDITRSDTDDDLSAYSLKHRENDSKLISTITDIRNVIAKPRNNEFLKLAMYGAVGTLAVYFKDIQKTMIGLRDGIYTMFKPFRYIMSKLGFGNYGTEAEKQETITAKTKALQEINQNYLAKKERYYTLKDEIEELENRSDLTAEDKVVLKNKKKELTKVANEVKNTYKQKADIQDELNTVEASLDSDKNSLALKTIGGIAGAGSVGYLGYKGYKKTKGIIDGAKGVYDKIKNRKVYAHMEEMAELKKQKKFDKAKRDLYGEDKPKDDKKKNKNKKNKDKLKDTVNKKMKKPKKAKTSFITKISNKILGVLKTFKSKIIAKLGKKASGRLLIRLSSKIASRAVPFLGTALLVYDAGKIAYDMIHNGTELKSAISKQILGFDLFSDDEVPVDERGNPIKPDEKEDIKVTDKISNYFNNAYTYMSNKLVNVEGLLSATPYTIDDISKLKDSTKKQLQDLVKQKKLELLELEKSYKLDKSEKIKTAITTIKSNILIIEDMIKNKKYSFKDTIDIFKDTASKVYNKAKTEMGSKVNDVKKEYSIVKDKLKARKMSEAIARHNIANNQNYTNALDGKEDSKENSVKIESGNVGSVNMASGDIYDNAGGSDNLIIPKGVRIDGFNPKMRDLLFSMANEYYEKTGKKIPINSGYRSYEDQLALKKKYGAKAASPGKSTHEFGLAFDTNTSVANELDKLGLMKKYGFTRPVGKETWHVEPAGISLDIQGAKANRYLADKLIGISEGKGGQGWGLKSNARKYSRNKAYQENLLSVAGTAVKENKPANNFVSKVKDLATTAKTTFTPKMSEYKEKLLTKQKQLTTVDGDGRTAKNVSKSIAVHKTQNKAHEVTNTKTLTTVAKINEEALSELRSIDNTLKESLVIQKETLTLLNELTEINTNSFNHALDMSKDSKKELKEPKKHIRPTSEAMAKSMVNLNKRKYA